MGMAGSELRILAPSESWPRTRWRGSRRPRLQSDRLLLPPWPHPTPWGAFHGVWSPRLHAKAPQTPNKESPLGHHPSVGYTPKIRIENSFRSMDPGKILEVGWRAGNAGSQNTWRPCSGNGGWPRLFDPKDSFAPRTGMQQRGTNRALWVWDQAGPLLTRCKGSDSYHSLGQRNKQTKEKEISPHYILFCFQGIYHELWNYFLPHLIISYSA